MNLSFYLRFLILHGNNLIKVCEDSTVLTLQALMSFVNCHIFPNPFQAVRQADH